MKKKIKSYVRKLLTYTEWHIAIPICIKTPFLSRIYFLFSSHFQRENRAVLYGQYMYRRELWVSGKNLYMLIRNIHGLEKGISMRNRKEVFGESYIQETVALYKNFEEDYRSGSTEISACQLQWAHDVIDHFFQITKHTPPIASAYTIFRNIRFNGTQTGKLIPYQRKSSVFSSVQYDEFLNLANQRRSVRWFMDKTVPRKLIDKAIEVALLSPSDCNRMPCEFIVIDSPELVSKVSPIPMGTDGFSDNIPVLVVVVGKLNAYLHGRDRHGIYINTGLASMTFMYALETLGLACCPINWPDIEEREKKLEDILGLQPYERPTMLMGIGYPDPNGLIPYSAKKNVEQVRKFFKK